MQQAKHHGWTYTEYLKLGDEHRYEIINGELYTAPAPGLEHQRVSRNLQYLFIRFITKHKLGEVLNVPVDVILSPAVVIQPDIVFIHKDRANICQERGVFGPPDLIVEIISRTSITRDRHSKWKLYRNHGVKEYWLIQQTVR